MIQQTLSMVASTLEARRRRGYRGLALLSLSKSSYGPSDEIWWHLSCGEQPRLWSILLHTIEEVPGPPQGGVLEVGNRRAFVDTIVRQGAPRLKKLTILCLPRLVGLETLVLKASAAIAHELEAVISAANRASSPLLPALQRLRVPLQATQDDSKAFFRAMGRTAAFPGLQILEVYYTNMTTPESQTAAAKYSREALAGGALATLQRLELVLKIGSGDFIFLVQRIVASPCAATLGTCQSPLAGSRGARRSARSE